jgi:hypothetical protein
MHCRRVGQAQCPTDLRSGPWTTVGMGSTRHSMVPRVIAGTAAPIRVGQRRSTAHFPPRARRVMDTPVWTPASRGHRACAVRIRLLTRRGLRLRADTCSRGRSRARPARLSSRCSAHGCLVRGRPQPAALSFGKPMLAQRDPSAGRISNEPPCSGVTARNALSSRVRMRRVRQRPASTTSEASAKPSSRSR